MEIPFDLLYIVASYYTKPRMKLLDWIDKEKLNLAGLAKNINAIQMIESYLRHDPKKISWCFLSENSNLLQAIHILEKNIDKIDWYELSFNPQALHILETVLQHDPEKIKWDYLSRNPNAIHLLEIVIQHDIDKINWNWLSRNPNAIHILEKHPDKINWAMLSGNPNALHLLEKHPDKIDWAMLSGNPNALHLFEKYHENPLAIIDWRHLSFNNNPKAIDILENHPKSPLYTMRWEYLSENPNAIHLLKAHPEKINWTFFSSNPSIFEIDTIQMKIELTKRAKNIDFYK